MTNGLNNPEQPTEPPKPPDAEAGGNEINKELFKQLQKLHELLEFDDANGLCIALYEEEILPPEQPSPEDPLTSLENIVRPKPPEIKKRLIGGCYRLDIEGTEYLIVLSDGIIIKIAASEKDHLRKRFIKELTNLKEKKISDLYAKIIIDPIAALELWSLGTVVYRTDDPLLNPKDIANWVSEDGKRALEIKGELLRRKRKNIKEGCETFLSSQTPDEPPSSS